MKNKIAILFGPEGGNTERVTQLVANKIGNDKCTVIPVNKVTPETISEFNSFIIGGSTIGTHNWSIANSSHDWDVFLPEFRKMDFRGKKVALFGLGDHLAYPNNFVDGMRTIYNVLVENNATIVGQCKTDDYEFNESEAVVDGKFVGLPIDEDFEDDLTENRIDKWLNTFINKL
ncbi:MAG: flavodoxin [Salinivirgaceae bacterium]|jgi:flavodoxin I|nr:flavodoxin [Salinivirgaceae bacterium]